MKKNLKNVREFDNCQSQSLLSPVYYGFGILVGIMRSFANPHSRTLESSPSTLPFSTDATDDSLSGWAGRSERSVPPAKHNKPAYERRTFLGWFSAYLFLANSRLSSANHPIPFDSTEGTEFNVDLPKTLADLKADANFLIENKAKIETAMEAIQFGGQAPSDVGTTAIARVICRKNLDSDGRYIEQLQSALLMEGRVEKLVDIVEQKIDLCKEPNLSETLKAYEYLVNIELLELVSALLVPLELASLFRRSD